MDHREISLTIATPPVFRGCAEQLPGCWLHHCRRCGTDIDGTSPAKCLHRRHTNDFYTVFPRELLKGSQDVRLCVFGEKDVRRASCDKSFLHLLDADDVLMRP